MMRLLLCTTVFATALLGAYANLQGPQAPASVNSVLREVPVISFAEAEKQVKQSLFGTQIDVNLNKNGTLIPIPSFISLNTSYGAGVGAGGNLIVPLAFPLGLLFPSFPPLNLTLGFQANKNISLAMNAGAGNVSSIIDENPGWAPPPPTEGWSAPSSTPGWSEPPSTPGWEAPTTPGWSAPSSTPGWVAPSTPGWAPPPSSTPGWAPPPSSTPGWAPPPPSSTPGWGPGWKKEDGKGKNSPKKQSVA